MDLHVWAPDFGLPSINQKCLAFISYCRFSGAPVNIMAKKNPLWTSQGDFPEFRHQGKVVTDLSTLISYLDSRKFNVDYNLTPKQKSEAFAYSKRINSDLEPAVALMFWVDPTNFTEFTRPWLAKNLTFPLGLFYPRRYHKRALDLIHASTSVDCDGLSSNDLEFSLMEKSVISKAQSCLQALSDRLGANPYMFGANPTSLDALVFSYLAPVLKVQVPSKQIPNILQQYPNLVQFVSRIVTTYFPGLPTFSTSSSSTERSQTSDSSNNDEDASEKFWTLRNVGVSLIAVLAMTSYAVLTNLFFRGKKNRRRRR